MIDITDVKLRDRASKAIFNIRLIASRVKRANLEDSMQRAQIVVASLDSIRKYLVARFYNSEIAGVDTTFKHDRETMTELVEALQQVDIIYNMLTKTKRTSYREEVKQVKLFYVDVIEYLETILRQGD